MKIKEVCNIIESFAPLSYQESYDNSGLQTGNPNSELKGILLTIDVTEDIVEEAILHNCNMIIAHHPVIFKPLKKLTGSNYVERVIEKAIKNDIAIYAAHTNLDSVNGGVSTYMANKIGLENIQILDPQQGQLLKLVCFVPENFAEVVREEMFKNGAGNIGKYDSCSFNTKGTGSFKAGENTSPFVGSIGEMHYEPEVRVETIVESPNLSKCISAMIKAHPYEEVAYDVYPLQNTNPNLGLGAIGVLNEYEQAKEFILRIKKIFNCGVIKYSGKLNNKIKTVAMCGGSGSFLINKAIKSGADIFISADIKYHEYFIPENDMIIADIGHYESEQFTKQIFYELLMKKNPKFAIRFSDINSNPIKHI
ncbi:MAG TPA: Nif3-like dinuclear metal center hexameric protein [Bacteroidales bacterium]|nr:Nif3-like dinuclear metal center hexameric protein [Bacteroidales bacterium]